MYFQVGQRTNVHPSLHKHRQSAQLLPLNIVELPDTNQKLGADRSIRDLNSSMKQSIAASEYLSQSLNESLHSKNSSLTQNLDPDPDVVTENMQQMIKSSKTFNKGAEHSSLRTLNSSLGLFQTKTQAEAASLHTLSDNNKSYRESMRSNAVNPSYRRQGGGEMESRRSSLKQQLETNKGTTQDSVRDFMASIGLPTDKVVNRDMQNLSRGNNSASVPPPNQKSFNYPWTDQSNNDALADILG